jgi:hypothetical protein
MGRMVLTIPDDLEQKFRNAVFRRYGMRRGNLTKAVKEAIEQWILSVEKEVSIQLPLDNKQGLKQ